MYLFNYFQFSSVQRSAPLTHTSYLLCVCSSLSYWSNRELALDPSGLGGRAPRAVGGHPCRCCQDGESEHACRLAVVGFLTPCGDSFPYASELWARSTAFIVLAVFPVAAGTVAASELVAASDQSIWTR